MNLKARRKETGNHGKGGRHAAADHECHHHADTEGNGGEIENMAEQSAGVDTFVHDHRCQNHACTDHTADGEVGTGEQDQTADAKRQEHARGSRLQDVQDVVQACSDGILTVEQRNRFAVGETLEVLSPGMTAREFTVASITDELGTAQDCAPHPQQTVLVPCPYELRYGDILRRRGGEQVLRSC